MSEVLIQLADEHNRLVGVGTKQDSIDSGLWRRIAFVMLHNVADSAVLLQRRAKEPFKDRWTGSATGHVDAADTPGHLIGSGHCGLPRETQKDIDAAYYPAALREAAEEISVTDVELEDIGSFQIIGDDGFQAHARLFQGTIDYTPQLTDVNPREVKEIRWLRCAELLQAVAAEPDEFTPGLQVVASQFYGEAA